MALYIENHVKALMFDIVKQVIMKTSWNSWNEPVNILESNQSMLHLPPPLRDYTHNPQPTLFNKSTADTVDTHNPQPTLFDTSTAKLTFSRRPCSELTFRRRACSELSSCNSCTVCNSNSLSAALSWCSLQPVKHIIRSMCHTVRYSWQNKIRYICHTGKTTYICHTVHYSRQNAIRYLWPKP